MGPEKVTPHGFNFDIWFRRRSTCYRAIIMTSFSFATCSHPPAAPCSVSMSILPPLRVSGLYSAGILSISLAWYVVSSILIHSALTMTSFPSARALMAILRNKPRILLCSIGLLGLTNILLNLARSANLDFLLSRLSCW